MGQELNRTIILPAIYCRSTPNQVKALLTRYIQQSSLHHKEFLFTILKRIYNLNITYTDLDSLYHYPELYNREFFGDNHYRNIRRLLNSTIKYHSRNDYEKYTMLLNKLSNEIITENTERNMY